MSAVVSPAAQESRAGAMLDDWATGMYRQAERWQRLFERSGETPDAKTGVVLDYLTHRFTHDTTGQMALFLAWREHRLTEPRRDPPEDYREHNLLELSLNVETFFTVLVNLGRLEPEEAAS